MSVPTAASCWVKSVWLSKWAVTLKTSRIDHPRSPTLHESVGLAAEVFEGSITDLPNAKAKRNKFFG
ncbi:hypothetical protein ACVXG7_01250 [Enterobacter hormaechei]